jgi:predicted HD phosphohydrolase
MGLPSTLDPPSVTSYLLSVLAASEMTPYIGEPISQLQHSLQCAALAHRGRADEATQIAALLHDVGQFVPAADLREAAERQRQRYSSSSSDESVADGEVRNLNGASIADSVGRQGHEHLGSRLLSQLGFPDKVCALVGAHVAAKRYLVAIDESYAAKLSDASVKSLGFQGGPMSKEEQERFAQGPWCKEMCRLRKWDDEAKIEGVVVKPTLEEWRGPMERVLAGEKWLQLQ